MVAGVCTCSGPPSGHGCAIRHRRTVRQLAKLEEKPQEQPEAAAWPTALTPNRSVCTRVPKLVPLSAAGASSVVCIMATQSDAQEIVDRCACAAGLLYVQTLRCSRQLRTHLRLAHDAELLFWQP